MKPKIGFLAFLVVLLLVPTLVFGATHEFVAVEPTEVIGNAYGTSVEYSIPHRAVGSQIVVWDVYTNYPNQFNNKSEYPAEFTNVLLDILSPENGLVETIHMTYISADQAEVMDFFRRFSLVSIVTAEETVDISHISYKTITLADLDFKAIVDTPASGTLIEKTNGRTLERTL